MPVSEVHAPLTDARPPTGNPGSTTGSDIVLASDARDSKFYALSWQPEMALGITSSTQKGAYIFDDESSLNLKPLGKVMRGPKQKIPVAHKMNLGSTITLRKRE